MLDWFDPGLDEGDFAAMRITLMDFAKANLKPTGAAFETYRGATGGSFHYTMLQAGMSHTAFTDLPWLTTPTPKLIGLGMGNTSM